MNTRTVFTSDPIRGTPYRPDAAHIGFAVRIPARVWHEYVSALSNGNPDALNIAAARLNEYDLDPTEVQAAITAGAAGLGLVPTRGTMEVVEYVEAETGDTMKLYRMPFREVQP